MPRKSTPSLSALRAKLQRMDDNRSRLYGETITNPQNAQALHLSSFYKRVRIETRMLMRLAAQDGMDPDFLIAEVDCVEESLRAFSEQLHGYLTANNNGSTITRTALETAYAVHQDPA